MPIIVDPSSSRGYALGLQGLKFVRGTRREVFADPSPRPVRTEKLSCPAEKIALAGVMAPSPRTSGRIPIFTHD
jgi:hypothetical protein